MGQVQVLSLEIPRQVDMLSQLWRALYVDRPDWVAWLDVLKDGPSAYFNPDIHPYFHRAAVQFFVVLKDGAPVGSICAHLDRAEVEVGYFGFFEFVDDLCVAQCLFVAACDWLREQGATEVQGPFCFTRRAPFALLVEGHDAPSFLCECHPAYYTSVYQQLGLIALDSWFTYALKSLPTSAYLDSVVSGFLSKNMAFSLRSSAETSRDEDMELICGLFKTLAAVDEDLSPWCEEEFRYLYEQLHRYHESGAVAMVFSDKQLVGAMIGLPELGPRLCRERAQTRLLSWAMSLISSPSVDCTRFGSVAVHPSFQDQPILELLLHQAALSSLARAESHLAFPLVCETDEPLIQLLGRVGGHRVKTHRTYGADLSQGADTEWIELKQRADGAS